MAVSEELELLFERVKGMEKKKRRITYRAEFQADILKLAQFLAENRAISLANGNIAHVLCLHKRLIWRGSRGLGGEGGDNPERMVLVGRTMMMIKNDKTGGVISH